MHRLLGTLLICCLATLFGSSAAQAYDSPQKYGVEFRGGFGTYDMGDITEGTKYLQRQKANSKITSGDSGPTGGISFLFRPTKHTLWEVGYNALFDVENLVESSSPDTSGQLLMHGNEFYLMGHVVGTLSDRIHLNLGAGLGYYNVEVQKQDDFTRSYVYDADGRAFGLLATAGLELVLTERFGLHLAGGARVANATHFSYLSSGGTRTGLNVLGGSRPMEVNLSGAYGALGLRFYFDKVTKPIDFSR